MANDQGGHGYHDDEELRAGGPDLQRAVWESFHGALAAMHSVDVAQVPTAHRHRCGRRWWGG
ncbi:MAG: hypothetical protein U0W40_17320 [Acidimicrobiia bacterium]